MMNGDFRTNTQGRTDAFTLTELLVVIGIISVLAGLAWPVVAVGKVGANRVACASNLRQIGAALALYTGENDGFYPQTTHSTGSRNVEESWIYVLAPYLGDVDKVRVCPADPPARKEQILARKASSYALNELVFDSLDYNQSRRLSAPDRTLLAVVLSENRTPSATWDHVHSSQWTSWAGMLNDCAVDRHMFGRRSKMAVERTRGDSNYLYADGRVATISAEEMKRRVDRGENPAAVP